MTLMPFLSRLLGLYHSFKLPQEQQGYPLLLKLILLQSHQQYSLESLEVIHLEGRFLMMPALRALQRRRES